MTLYAQIPPNHTQGCGWNFYKFRETFLVALDMKEAGDATGSAGEKRVKREREIEREACQNSKVSL